MLSANNFYRDFILLKLKKQKKEEIKKMKIEVNQRWIILQISCENDLVVIHISASAALISSAIPSSLRHWSGCNEMPFLPGNISSPFE